MTTPYTVTTPEYVAWAKRGEEVGKSKEVFNGSIDKLIDVLGDGYIDSRVYNAGRNKLKESFDLFDSCECEGECDKS